MRIPRAGDVLLGIVIGVAASAVYDSIGLGFDWWRWQIGQEDSVRLEEPQNAKPFFEQTLYSISDRACDPAAKEETDGSCSVLLDFEPDEIRDFVTERVPFYSSGTHREILEAFLNQNAGCLDWTSRWTMNGQLYSVRAGKEMRRGADGRLVCPRQMAREE